MKKRLLGRKTSYFNIGTDFPLLLKPALSIRAPVVKTQDVLYICMMICMSEVIGKLPTRPAS